MMFPLHCMERHGNFPKIQAQCDLLSSTDGEISEFSGPSFQKVALSVLGQLNWVDVVEKMVWNTNFDRAHFVGGQEIQKKIHTCVKDGTEKHQSTLGCI